MVEHQTARAPRWIVGITGASGAIYGLRLCEELLAAGVELHLVITDSGWRVFKEELDWDVARRRETLAGRFAEYSDRLHYHDNRDIGAPIASGSFRTEGMVIIPCSMGSLSAIAHGASTNLLTRAADVMLKEGRKLLLVPRETPLHAIHLENMLTLARLGARLIPAMPAFYYKPQSMEEMIDFLVGKVMDNLPLAHNLYRRWGEDQHEEQSSDNPRTD